MADAKPNGAVCQVCKEHKPQDELLPAELVRDDVVAEIRRDVPDWTDEGFICTADLKKYHMRNLRGDLEKVKGKLSPSDLAVLDEIESRTVLSRNIAADFEQSYTFGQRLADRIAAFGGSWTFILIFMGVLVGWIILNSAFLFARPFDPYPFILLNLVLSCLAALQAPVIMMSQNRQEARDRRRAENDYRVNLKAELEIQQLHEKMEHYLTHHWHRLLQIQRTQLDLMNRLLKESNGATDKSAA